MERFRLTHTQTDRQTDRRILTIEATLLVLHFHIHQEDGPGRHGGESPLCQDGGCLPVLPVYGGFLKNKNIVNNYALIISYFKPTVSVCPDNFTPRISSQPIKVNSIIIIGLLFLPLHITVLSSFYTYLSTLLSQCTNSIFSLILILTLSLIQYYFSCLPFHTY